ncbi:MAG: prepilin-type N-terminal cleavage/methylation domain-containing protein [Alphaproteobacteria bacterium]|nr:prepilin-type N-terminal cleavage/methylation domain-containing protein [Alphaproteobacteria bacterium]
MSSRGDRHLPGHRHRSRAPGRTVRRPDGYDLLTAEAGFTLFEIIAVLVIAALLATTVIFSSRPAGGAAQLKALAGTIAAGLRRTRGHAIRNSREAIARIDVAATRIVWENGIEALDLGRGIGLEVTGATSEAKGAVAGIRFFPNGSSTGGRLRISSDRARFDIAVNWLTGRVSVEQVR